VDRYSGYPIKFKGYNNRIDEFNVTSNGENIGFNSGFINPDFRLSSLTINAPNNNKVTIPTLNSDKVNLTLQDGSEVLSMMGEIESFNTLPFLVLNTNISEYQSSDLLTLMSDIDGFHGKGTFQYLDLTDGGNLLLSNFWDSFTAEYIAIFVSSICYLRLNLVEDGEDNSVKLDAFIKALRDDSTPRNRPERTIDLSAMISTNFNYSDLYNDLITLSSTITPNEDESPSDYWRIITPIGTFYNGSLTK
jgi:hypothetical protein